MKGVNKHQNRNLVQTYLQFIMILLMLLALMSLIIMTLSQLNTETAVRKIMIEISEDMKKFNKQEKIDETIIQQTRKDWNYFE